MSTTRILVAVDFESCSETAVITAADLARAKGGRVFLLHAIAPVAGVPWDTPIAPTPGAVAVALSDHLETRAREGLHRLQRLAGDVWVDTDVRFGHPVETILSVAEEVGADLIVLGTHGRKGVTRWLLGSVAEAVLRRSEVPVMTVRHSEHVQQQEAESGHLSVQ